jgi:hypothetical protein
VLIQLFLGDILFERDIGTETVCQSSILGDASGLQYEPLLYSDRPFKSYDFKSDYSLDVNIFLPVAPDRKLIFCLKYFLGFY